MSRAARSTVGHIIYDGVAYSNAAFWLFCTAGIKSNVAGIQDATFNAMQKVGTLTQLERDFDAKASIREAQLIFACLTMSLLALAGAVAAVKNIVDGVRNPVVGTAKKLSLAFDGVAYTNAAFWLIVTALTAADVGHSRQMTLDTMVSTGALKQWEAELDPTAGIRAAQLLFGMATLFPFAIRHVAADASKVVSAISRLSCIAGRRDNDDETRVIVVSPAPIPAAEPVGTRVALSTDTDQTQEPLLLQETPEAASTNTPRVTL